MPLKRFKTGAGEPLNTFFVQDPLKPLMCLEHSSDDFLFWREYFDEMNLSSCEERYYN